ncbi:NAD(P)H-dependent flavin oxidoreductase [Ottowia sp. VDI28]|uniref:NAD(P)H-dependent flavin oxidoreductase n=1 Tax=Ottowia sp. VDI28 TaxID=3133968 RepID=UPI003C2B30DD
MNTLCAQLGIALPLIQAPMAGAQGSTLALAVGGTGGLGSMPSAMLAVDPLRAELQKLNQSGLPYNVNFFAHTPPLPDAARDASWRQALAPYYAEYGLDVNAIPNGPGRQPFSAEIADVLTEFKPKIVSFHFGLPSPELLARVKAWGAFVLSSATTVREALWLQERGADAVIAQGLEAGGHRGHFLSMDLTEQMGTFALLPQIVAAVRIPVIAAGGIADAAGVRAAMGLGASAVQVGTAYLCSDETSTSAMHRAALQSEAARHTALTNLFSGRPARGIVNRLMRELGPISSAAPEFPQATNAIGPLRAAAEKVGCTDFTPLWSGQNASACTTGPAAEITHRLAEGFK